MGCLGWAVLQGQPVPTQGSPFPPGGAAPAPGPSSGATGINVGAPNADAEALGALADRYVDPQSSGADFENGTLQWNGKTFDLGQSRAARARFERFLTAAESFEDVAAYRAIIGRIEELLSTASMVNRQDANAIEVGREHTFTAWQLLFEAGRYEFDEGVCVAIANQVHNIWRVTNESGQLDRAKVLIERERTEYERLLFATRRSLDSERREALNPSMIRTPTQAANAQQRAEYISSQSADAGRLALQVERFAEMNARLAAMDAQREVMGLQAKMEFQSLIFGLMTARKFEHVNMAAGFYRQVFSGGHQSLIIGKEQIQEYFPVSDFTATIDTIHALSREALADVRTGLRAIRASLQVGDLMAALERTQETFALGEYVIAVRELPEEPRQRMLSLYRDLRALKSTIDLKDYGRAEGLLAGIEAIALDFPSNQFRSAIQAVTRLSDLSVLAARRAVAMQDFAGAEASLTRAAELWPLNPNVESFTRQVADRADASSDAIRLFDSLYEAGDERGIYRRARESVAFAGGLQTSPERAAQLDEIVRKLGQVDGLLLQATEMANHNAFAAWELLAGAHELAPSDVEVARARARLAPRVAVFIGELERAEQAEQQGFPAVAVNRYLAARRLYPFSRLCEAGLQRASGVLMEQLARQSQPTSLTPPAAASGVAGASVDGGASRGTGSDGPTAGAPAGGGGDFR